MEATWCSTEVRIGNKYSYRKPFEINKVTGNTVRFFLVIFICVKYTFLNISFICPFCLLKSSLCFSSRITVLFFGGSESRWFYAAKNGTVAQ